MSDYYDETACMDGACEVPARGDDLQHEKKKERARNYARRRRRELAWVHDKALLVYNELVRLGVYDKLSNEAREFFEVYSHREVVRQSSFPPTMYKMFGSVIAPGVSVTLRDAMQRLYKGKNEVNYLVRSWEKKHGVHISITQGDSGAALDLKYTIDRIDPHDELHVEDVSEIMSEKERRGFMDYERERR